MKTNYMERICATSVYSPIYPSTQSHTHIATYKQKHPQPSDLVTHLEMIPIIKTGCPNSPRVNTMENLLDPNFGVSGYK